MDLAGNAFQADCCAEVLLTTLVCVARCWQRWADTDSESKSSEFAGVWPADEVAEEQDHNVGGDDCGTPTNHKSRAPPAYSHGARGRILCPTPEQQQECACGYTSNHTILGHGAEREM